MVAVPYFMEIGQAKPSGTHMQTHVHQTTQQPPTRRRAIRKAAGDRGLRGCVRLPRVFVSPLRAFVLPLLVMAVAAGPAVAQSVDINAEVPVRSPTGAGTRNLTFGEIVPLVAADQIVNVVAAAGGGSVQSGEFRYNVGGVRGVVFNVAVPTELTMAGAPALAMTSNGTQYGAYCMATGPTCTLTNFNPATAGNITICRTTFFGFCVPWQAYAAGTTMRVYVGGRLTVPPTARAGVYTGTVTLTIVQVY